MARPSWLQNEKCSEFIEIWLILQLQYAHLDLDVKNDDYY